MLLTGFSKHGACTIPFMDTAKNQQAGYAKAAANVNKVNVIYPEILTGSESQSIAYIEQFCASRRAYLVRTFNKGKQFFPKIAAILKKYDLPQEFKVLIALESGFNPNAKSAAGAVGYWQIMDPVAKEYGLKIAEEKAVQKHAKRSKKGKAKPEVDERKNFHKSTYAAARYLKDRCRNLNNDLLLIVASYNWGVGNVWNAMEKTGKNAPTFWDIKKYLPAETKAYVMNFIALNVILHNYEKFSNNTLSFEYEVPCKAEDCTSADNGDCISFSAAATL